MLIQLTIICIREEELMPISRCRFIKLIYQNKYMSKLLSKKGARNTPSLTAIIKIDEAVQGRAGPGP